MKKFILYAAVLLLSSCVGELKELSISGINDFKITRLSPQGIEGEIAVTIKNPNSTSFRVYRSQAEILYGGVKLGRARSTKKVRIGANSEVEHVFVLKGDLKDVTLADLPTLFLSKNKPMEINGYIKAGKWYYRHKFPINQKQRLKGLDFKGGIPGF
jgi:LEA14-like dessication related protein